MPQESDDFLVYFKLQGILCFILFEILNEYTNQAKRKDQGNSLLLIMFTIR